MPKALGHDVGKMHFPCMSTERPQGQQPSPKRPADQPQGPCQHHGAVLLGDKPSSATSLPTASVRPASARPPAQAQDCSSSSALPTSRSPHTQSLSPTGSISP